MVDECLGGEVEYVIQHGEKAVWFLWRDIIRLPNCVSAACLDVLLEWG